MGVFSRWKVNRDCVSYAIGIGIGIGIGFLIFLGNMTYREEEEGERARSLVEKIFPVSHSLGTHFCFFLKKKGGGGVSKSKNMYSAVSIHCAFSFSLVSTFEEKTPSSFHAP